MWQMDGMRVSALLLVTMVVAVLTTPVVGGEATPVWIRVEQPSTSRTLGDTRTETRSLKLSIRNVSAEALDLKVRYFFIGRNVALSPQTPLIPTGMCGVAAQMFVWPPRGDAVVAGTGEQPVPVKSGSAIIVETPAVTAVSTRPKIVNGRLEKGKGTKFLGYAVRVYRGNEVVAEACEPREFARWAFWGQPFSK